MLPGISVSFPNCRLSHTMMMVILSTRVFITHFEENVRMLTFVMIPNLLVACSKLELVSIDILCHNTIRAILMMPSIHFL